ncbi:MAG TPA: response regulator [Polyangiaceae bacterium]|jgi:DNA-binding NarL/FixJ family response regulator|nr:response regulator [Polyangiaceae bacterium]
MRKDPAGPRHILVIDDSEVLLSRIKKALVDDGHVVTTTTQTVGNARHLATCDLVIIDYHMPGINGLAVQQAMRAAAAHLDHEPLFYLYTSDRAVSSTYAELGFDGAFPKGDEAVLAQQVRAVFRLSQIRAMAQKERPAMTPSEHVLASRDRPSGSLSERAPTGKPRDKK